VLGPSSARASVSVASASVASASAAFLCLELLEGHLLSMLVVIFVLVMGKVSGLEDLLGSSAAPQQLVIAKASELEDLLRHSAPPQHSEPLQHHFQC